ncbi:Astacin (Peptidase M12A) [Parelaphostrongylus tenuis]|uniref:Astacin (Peptidase M12A) n=1 Tax=Parelaphostrongylus tenuis TaxID=148309 RepID=A0AAD5R701_PARTN|nr:Astacin (Peptidase M12A) [Parelaphostrongylus tenuis]KAJ1370879.1 Astacin (Peptidase M12A) [Parelaphostrongylus tenuis]
MNLQSGKIWLQDDWHDQFNKESERTNYNYNITYDYDKCSKESSAKCENGGFPHPRDCSKCICPSGYGGRLCNERPSGCGKILTATNEYQELWDVVGNKNYVHNGENDEFYFCNYWIQVYQYLTALLCMRRNDHPLRGHLVQQLK